MASEKTTRSSPTHRTFNLLYARSGNRCAFPKCPNPITLNETLLGEVAHIKAASPTGPRYDPTQTDEDRRSYDNLILLCGVHHKFVDDDDEAYTVTRLEKMKADHEEKAIDVSKQDVDKASELFIQGGQNILTDTLHNSGVMQQIHNYYGIQPPANDSSTAFSAVHPLEGQSRFRAKGKSLGMARSQVPFVQSKEENRVFLREGPTLWLRLQPTERLLRELRFAELEQFRYKLTTLFPSADQTVTAPDGFGRYRMAYDIEHAGAVSFFFRNGELWSIDLAGFFESELGKHFAFHETRDALFAHLPHFAEIMNDAGIKPPYKWIAGLEGVEGYRLNAGRPGSMHYFDNTRFMVDRVVATGSYSPGDVPAEALDDFFEALYAECGAHRPDHLVYRSERS